MITVPELLIRAKRAIEFGETSLQAAAEDIAGAQEQRATQRQIAGAVGKSAAWVTHPKIQNGAVMNCHRSIRPSFKAHARVHEEVLGNETWFGDGEPVMGKQFTAGKLGDDRLGARLELLAGKLEACRPQYRCGSLACPECSRSFQRAKAAGQIVLIRTLMETQL